MMSLRQSAGDAGHEKAMTSPEALPKILAQMQSNPKGDWGIGDVERLCNQIG